MIDLDAVDLEILRALQAEGRLTNAELARRVNLSPPAIHARVRRLEEQGVIRGYVALVDPASLGYDMLCFINIRLQTHQFEFAKQFREDIQAKPEVLECHHLTGEFDYLLKVVIKNRQDLERFVVQELTPLHGVSRIYTSLVLSEIKSGTAVPL
ncbi:MAG: Lrp/AsnC family transcriptional regulator [Candidatus Promineifilaceae bacterium]|nr:Lrp/AsnC family transcriptional regulator [Anaerolineaceae bacterium]